MPSARLRLLPHIGYMIKLTPNIVCWNFTPKSDELAWDFHVLKNAKLTFGKKNAKRLWKPKNFTVTIGLKCISIGFNRSLKTCILQNELLNI